ncbi:MAG: PA14 domain-containing protein, partial [Bacteroidota bacterium]
PLVPPDTIDPVVVLDFSGQVLTYHPPVIVASVSIFLNSLNVTMEVPSKDLEIHYTLDGSLPTQDSHRYTGPVQLAQSTMVKARSFYKGHPVSEVVEREFRKVEPRPSVSEKDLGQGLRYKYYEGEWDRLPEFEKLQPAASGISSELDLKMRRRDEKFALRFTGYLTVPEDNVYMFSLTSDDGSKFYIGDQLVIDNDGLHGSLEKQGYVALAKGAHPITITYFNKLGGKELDLRMGAVSERFHSLTQQEIMYKP